MIVTAWNDGKHLRSGAGYGVKIDAIDRNRYFDRNWSSVFVRIEDSEREVEINVAKDSFWNDTCRELISKNIGSWLRDNKLAPWPKGHPPELALINIQGNHFHLKLR